MAAQMEIRIFDDLPYCISQSVLAQDLSWSSFKEVDENRNNEVLNQRFQQYMTNFDFSVVSNNLNHQKVYRTAREVLGVIKMNSEIEKN